MRREGVFPVVESANDGSRGDTQGENTGKRIRTENGKQFHKWGRSDKSVREKKRQKRAGQWRRREESGLGQRNKGKGSWEGTRRNARRCTRNKDRFRQGATYAQVKSQPSQEELRRTVDKQYKMEMKGAIEGDIRIRAANIMAFKRKQHWRVSPHLLD